MTEMERPIYEFSRPVAVEQLPAKVSRRTITAEAAERAALARRLDLLDLASLNAQIEMEPIGRKGLVRVKGRLTAELTQACVVTLAPLTASIDENFELTFGPDDAEVAEDGEIELSLDSQDPPDPIIDGVIDLGEVVVEHLSLAIDPFPRSPGAAFAAPPEEAEVQEPRPNPFAVLAALRQKGE